MHYVLQARQVLQVFPHMPLNIVMDDLRMTRSVDFTIENILEGRLQAPPVSIDTTLKFLNILPPSNFTINTVKFKLQGSFHGVIIPNEPRHEKTGFLHM